MALKMILLDAGHGGMIDGVYQTKGKRSPVWEDGSQYFEGVGNRLIREELAKMLRKEGIRFKFVNEGQKDLSRHERVAFINSVARKYGPTNVLCISIHSDGFPKESANGWSCYTSVGDTGSDIYAEALYEEAEKVFPGRRYREDNTDGDRDIEKNFDLLKLTYCYSILSENFFMTNEKDCKEILMTKQGRRKIAEVHFNMIKRFWKS